MYNAKIYAESFGEVVPVIKVPMWWLLPVISSCIAYWCVALVAQSLHNLQFRVHYKQPQIKYDFFHISFSPLSITLNTHNY